MQPWVATVAAVTQRKNKTIFAEYLIDLQEVWCTARTLPLKRQQLKEVCQKDAGTSRKSYTMTMTDTISCHHSSRNHIQKVSGA